MSLISLLPIAMFILALSIYILGPQKLWASIFGPADQGRIVFKTLKRSKLPNTALICPVDYCDNAKSDTSVPQFGVPADKLREKFRAGLKFEKNLERVHINDPMMRERYVQRSPIMRFPDTIQVEYIPLGPNRSTIALYSRSQIGISDRGVNLNRLQRWLKRTAEIQVSDE